ncbi:MAG TPA: hypothetical protein VFP22_00710 [Candidatus Limnocylindrales bacterium]|nr:hypothetical protein [Candidatus Limnocylindrales bacterium]
MDPRDDLDSLAGGVDCAACGAFVPTGRIRILARRDDIVFVEVTCPACRSDSLGIVMAETDDEVDGEPVGPGHPHGEFEADDIDRFREALPIAAADVDLVRGILAEGGLAALIGRDDRPYDPPAFGPSR